MPALEYAPAEFRGKGLRGVPAESLTLQHFAEIWGRHPRTVRMWLRDRKQLRLPDGTHVTSFRAPGGEIYFRIERDEVPA